MRAFYCLDVDFSYSAKQVLGKPNVYPRYGDIGGTWTQAAGQLDRVHFIEVNSLCKFYHFSFIFLNRIFNIKISGMRMFKVYD